MDKQELIHTHEFFHAIKEPLEDHIDDNRYDELNIFGPEGITGDKTDHKEAAFTLAEILIEELDENPELIEELDLNYDKGDTKRLWTPDEEEVEDTVEERENIVEDTIWSKPESEVITSVNEISTMLKTGDTNSISVVESLLQNEVIIGDSDGRVYGGMIERIDTSLKKYGIKFISSGKAEIENPNKIEVPEEGLELRILGLDDIEDSKYAVRNYRDNVENDYVRRVNEFDTLVSLPTLRPKDGIGYSFEIYDEDDQVTDEAKVISNITGIGFDSVTRHDGHVKEHYFPTLTRLREEGVIEAKHHENKDRREYTLNPDLDQGFVEKVEGQIGQVID